MQQENSNRQSYCLSLPKTADQFIKTTSIKCPKCKRICYKIYLCLLCKTFSCHDCQNPKIHANNNHLGTCIFLDLKDGKWVTYYKGFYVMTDCLYFNFFRESWLREKDVKGYELDSSRIESFYDSLLVGEVPQAINMEKLGSLLNERYHQ